MSKLFDALTRSLLEKYPADWLNQLGLIHGEPVRVMNSDLSSVTAEADKVIRVEGPQPWLVHIELQAGYRVHVSFCFFLLSLCGFWGDG